MVPGVYLYTIRQLKSDVILIPSARLTGHRQKTMSAKPINTNLTKIQMDFGIHGDSRGIKMQHIAF